jgi:hypothetical protein
MSRLAFWIASGAVVFTCAATEGSVIRSASSAVPSDQTATGAPAGQLIVTGRVAEIHSPRLFTVRETEGAGRQVLVLAPRNVSPAIVGAGVRVEGTLRRFDAAQWKQNPAWRDLDEPTRKRFSGRPVLIAATMMATREGEAPPEAARQPDAPSPVESPQMEQREARTSLAPPRAVAIRASTLVAHLDGFAGQQVRVLNARVVGVLEPRAFLIEPSTEYVKVMGWRDRIVVLLPDGALRVPADTLVGSVVAVEGIARTLLGVKVTAEVPWPDRLPRDAVDRLEVRAALLASSVQTAEGTELTTRENPGAQR